MLFTNGCRPASVVVFWQLLSTSSSEPLDGFWWNLVGIDEVLMVPYKCCFFLPDQPRGESRAGPNRSWGPILQRTSSSDQKATATNQMHSNAVGACGKSVVIFSSIPKVKFLTRFWRIFGLNHFGVFKCNFYRFLCGKVLYLHLFLIISKLISWKGSYKRFKCLKVFNEFLRFLLRWKKEEGVLLHVYIYIGTHSQPFLQNHFMDVYQSW